MGLFFNMNEEEREFAKSRTKFSLVIYDIVSNKRRIKLAHLLEGYGVRVQKSCFEVCLEVKEFKKMLSDLSFFYDEDEGDQIIVYTAYKEEVISFSPYLGAEQDEDMIFL